MRAEADELDGIFAGFVYQQQIWLDMAFAKARPFAAQGMIPVFFGNFVVVDQVIDNGRPIRSNQFAPLFFDIPPELGGRI